MTLWQDIKGWLYAPFNQQQDLVNWGLVVILTTTAAYFWSRILNNVLEE
jgi:hypothetical protein